MGGGTVGKGRKESGTVGTWKGGFGKRRCGAVWDGITEKTQYRVKEGERGAAVAAPRKFVNKVLTNINNIVNKERRRDC